MTNDEPVNPSLAATKRPGAARRLERKVRPYLQRLRAGLKEPILSVTDPEALKFYSAVMEKAYLPDDLIDVAPRLRLIYVAVPKAASSRIRSNLAAMLGHDTTTGWRSDENWRVHDRKASGLQAPRHGIRQFHRLATDPSALRFTFVRNPYTRLLSLWADQYREVPLVPGYGPVDVYLAHREKVDARLPHGPDGRLTFPQFVQFTCATAQWRIDRHWQLQDDLISVPGISYDLIGRMEHFATDFAAVLDHVGASDTVRQASMPPLHTSSRRSTADYFTPDLSDMVYKAYERDFDRTGYARKLPD